MKQASWLPINPYDRGHAEPYSHEATWDEGALAMAEALIQRIETLFVSAESAPSIAAHFFLLPKVDWQQLRRSMAC